MKYRRLFIIRKDLNMSPGKLAAQVAHCAEGYWTRLIQNIAEPIPDSRNGFYEIRGLIEKDEFEQYINGSFVKTICEAKNKHKLLRAKDIALELGLVENLDFGLIYDNCLTELTPEEENGTTLTGIWFRPLPDETAHQISRKYQLYR